jgi:hypothetical protein
MIGPYPDLGVGNPLNGARPRYSSRVEPLYSSPLCGAFAVILIDAGRRQDAP